MKKFLILLLVVVAFGCAKKYVKPAEEAPKPAKVEEARPQDAKKDVMAGEKVAPMAAEAKKEPMTLPKETVSVKEEAVFKDVLFDFDKYDIKADARAALDSAASWLKKNSAVKILVEGHCDERGTNEYNLALGEKRAKAAKDYLTSQGVSASRINTITYGEEKPLCTEQNEGCYQRNRRAHFVIAK
ncbi:MAG: peptidoglycan-associated lipoprotein Pal [Nitrospirae bacterium]|nr:peptidoglycan-associated lipoprotein Pal [Nitrospirota bacterium]